MLLPFTADDRTVSTLEAAVVFMVVSNEQLDAARMVAEHLPSVATVVNPYTGVVLPLDEMTGVDRPLGFVITPRAISAARAAVRRALRVAGGPEPVLVIGQDEGTIERVAVTAARKAGARVAILPDGIRTTHKSPITGRATPFRGPSTSPISPSSPPAS